jgi:hypothetical protein
MKKLKPRRHRMISKNPKTMTGVCQACGPVALRKQKSASGVVSFVCKQASLERMREYGKKRSPARGVWKHRMISRDPSTMTGVCERCGPVGLKKQKNRDGSMSYLCHMAYLTNSRAGKFRHSYRHGLTPKEFEARVIAQEGKCPLCGAQPDMLHIDHDHGTGEVRDLLCRSCNLMIGFARESAEILAAGIRYLEKWKRAAARQPAPGSTSTA